MLLWHYPVLSSVEIADCALTVHRLPEEIVNRLRFHYDESASRDIAEKVQQHINPNVIDPLPSHANTEVHVPSVVSPHSHH